MGLQAQGASGTEKKDTTRQGSSSRLGLQTGTRTGSSTRQAAGPIRGLGNRDGAASARGDDKTATSNLNSTLKKEGMNSTLRAGGRTPLPQRPGTSATTTPVKPVTRTVLPKDASKITPLEYKRLESQILDKSAEI